MKARKAHGSKEMDQSLISIPVLCDADCTVIFKKGNVQVIKNKKRIIEGPRDMETKLWLMPLKSNNNNNNNNNKANQATVCNPTKTHSQQCIPTKISSISTSMVSRNIRSTRSNDANSGDQQRLANIIFWTNSKRCPKTSSRINPNNDGTYA